MQGKDLSEAVSNRENIARIKNQYLSGKISRKVAEALAEPIINRINKKQQEIAKKYGKKSYPKTTFIGVMR
jgi:UDP-N-acetylglucosamine 2-epimerase